jgi:hypothetical protein
MIETEYEYNGKSWDAKGLKKRLICLVKGVYFLRLFGKWFAE